MFTDAARPKRYTLTKFSASAAEEATGASLMQQRSWRRQGYLPPIEGHARFTVFTLAELAAFQVLTQRGIGPLQAQAVTADCARGIAFHALAWRDAYTGADCWPEPSLSWDETMAVHRVHLMGQDNSLRQPKRFLLWWADDSCEFTDSLDAAVNGTVTADPKLAGPGVFIDLVAAGSVLVARAGVPFVRVEAFEPVDPDQSGPSLSRRAGLMSAF